MKVHIKPIGASLSYPLGDGGPASIDRIYAITVDGVTDVFREKDEPLMEEGDYDIPEETLNKLYDEIAEEYA